jgi:hypothetical protein
MKVNGLQSASATPWRDRAMVLAGKGGTGLLPVVMLGMCARLAGVRGVGEFAIAFSLAQSVAELADFTSQRHVSRVQLAAGAHDVRARLAAFNALRLLALAAGLASVAAILAAVLPPREALPSLVVLSSAVWLFANNTSYATALAEDEFLLVGAGPWVGLLAGVAVTLALGQARPSPGLWPVAAGLHAGKASETLVLWWRFGLPVASFGSGGLRREWAATRHLMYLGLVSAANARILVPLVALVVGVIGAGFISLGLNFHAGILLMAVAISVPAFRGAVNNRVVQSPQAAFRIVRGDWITAIALSVGLTTALLLVSGPLTRFVLAGASGEALLPVALVVAAAPFDTLSIFAGLCYHAAHDDRGFLRLTVATAVGSLLLVAAGGWLGATPGAALAFLLSRVVSASVFTAPLFSGGRTGHACDATRVGLG